MLYIISYDISVDRRRNAVARLLEGYGQRVLESVFECDLEPSVYRRLRQQLDRQIRIEEGDQMRIYQLCHGCQQRVDIVGNGPPLECSQDWYII